MIFEKRKCRQLDFPEKLPCGRLEKPKCTIREHKGQSSIRGIRVEIPRKLDAVAFCLLKNCLGNKMCELIVSVFRCRGFVALGSLRFVFLAEAFLGPKGSMRRGPGIRAFWRIGDTLRLKTLNPRL